MGKIVEVVIDEEGIPSEPIRITGRDLDVILLIGRDLLSYKAAAVLLPNKLIRVRGGEDPPHVSHHTVRRYATEIRDRFGLAHLPPMRALWTIYRDHRETLENGA